MIGTRDNVSPDTSRGWIVGALLLTGAALVLLFAAVPHAVTGDGYVRFQKLDALLRDGTFRPERYSLIGPLFASAFWLSDDPLWWAGRFNVLVLAAGAALGWVALKPVLSHSERAFFVLLLTATGMMPNTVRDFYGEAFSTVLVATGLTLVAVTGRWIGWVAVVVGVANTPATLVGLLLAAGVRFWKDRRFDGVAALVAAAALILLENWITRGAATDAGYLRDHGYVTILPFSGKSGFGYPFLLGALSLLFSFGKGLLFFAPALLLVPFVRRARPGMATVLDLWLAFLVGAVLVYAPWWAWYGGWKWGPRFLLFAVYPSSLALAIALWTPAPWPRIAATLLTAAWTVWVGVSGAVFDLDGLGVCVENQYALEHLCWYVPEYSPLLRPLVFPPEHLASWQLAWMLLAALIIGVLVSCVRPITRDHARSPNYSSGSTTSGSCAPLGVRARS